MDEILSELYEIQDHIEKLEGLRRSFSWDYLTILQFQKTLVSTFNYLGPVMEDLRSDLATRLTEQRSILESAKSEVEQNITGTPELIAVSETQRVRLDRQIGQFEELQRVLVKV